MKHLKTYNEYNKVNEDFEQTTLKKDDIVKVVYNNEERIAKVVDAKPQFVMVHLQYYHNFIAKPIKIDMKDVKSVLKNADEPASSSNWVKIDAERPSNDLALNNFPGEIPVANIMPY